MLLVSGKVEVGRRLLRKIGQEGRKAVSGRLLLEPTDKRVLR